jgi:hypothetical protein
MAIKALLQGTAGTYRIRGAVWEMGTSAYRAYVHLVPAARHSGLSRSVVSAEGTTLQQVLGATQAQVRSTVGSAVENLEVIPGRAPTPEPDTAPLRNRLAPRRYPSPTD